MLIFRYLPLGFLMLVLFSPLTIAQTVAISANTQYVVKDLANQFKKETGVEIHTVIGSSGMLTAQIRNGAPFDLFLSADTTYPMALWKDRFAVDSPRVYALGTLVVWSKKDIDLTNGLNALLDSGVKKIAIANPRNAPYGAAAMEALRKSSLLNKIESKIVYGESIAQVNQYVDTRTADVGFTAASVVLSDKMKGNGNWKEVDRSLYSPIPQAAVLLRSKINNEGKTARAFYEFLFSKKAKIIFRRYGYVVP